MQDHLIAQALRMASEMETSSGDIQVRLSQKNLKNKRKKNPGD